MPLLTEAAEALRLAGPDAVLTSHTAAYLYGCHAADQSPIHVLVRDNRRVRSRPGMEVHHGSFAERDVETFYGLEVLSFEHALAEVLCRGDPFTAIMCMEQALARVSCRRGFTDRVILAVRTRADPRGRREAELLLRGRCLGMA